ncbi:NADH-quinone oxidoreductase subunit C [Brevibacillus agri]|uniref:NADH-quinone oxidoreductase subunit C n=1 Tax=Brevibacillus agri TaxID=51101 RepID=UPI0018CE4E02|nr:NADH-quinone oxidoreductase subunit C [Brevibacillus agri]MBG9567846.1 NADH-quinone oxidoreductase subunit C [Brevibacillus agri]MBY0051238.1 NADH-quinone oxidoreductase subunit C [Brevibacillus agri]MED1641943.1 NADH-quinone oxidoreductase subunit C [Brevibacillus agri]MED1655144.1 NADH-quinone oxidoreductase subunit C [Brevibacillus agri]MED1687836.1 NADH-quinone oxidoreductase subunit C [Brevibacillus agri]
MSDEKRKPTPEEKAKAAAEARAKAEALRKLREQEGQAPQPEPEAEEAPAQAQAAEPQAEAAKPVSEMTPEEKAAAKKAAAAEAIAKAKAAKEAKEAAQQGDAAPTADGADADAKAKAAAAAKAKAAAAAAAKAKAAREAGGQAAEGGDDDAKAKAAAAAKAKAAAAAAAKAKAAQGDAPAAEEAPKAPSKNQPYLDKYVQRITEVFGKEVLEAAYINELGKEVPTLVIPVERWHEIARFLKEDEPLAFDYLSDLHGVDYEDRMEVYYHFYSYKNRQSLAVKVKTNREQPSVPSVMDIWHGANWNERETFDLLGIHFPGHNDLRRILLPDDWVGYPLRKDYVQYDEEV